MQLKIFMDTLEMTDIFLFILLDIFCANADDADVCSILYILMYVKP